MSTTLVAPMRTQQINKTIYVGQGMFPQIQNAVDYAVQNGGYYDVVIPNGYAGSDDPLNVVNGSNTVAIIDHRAASWQSYVWYQGVYTYGIFYQKYAVASPQLNNYSYVGEGHFQTIQSAVDVANNAGGGIVIIIEPSYSGSESIGAITGGLPSIYITDQRTAQWQNYEWNGTSFVPADFDQMGDATFAGLFNADGITANSAEFATCEVDNSPVRTYANTPDSGLGPSYPPPGIGVSTGTAWDANSIDPATLRTFQNTPNAIPQVYPPAGIGVSTGSAWETNSIDPATIPDLSGPNTFAGQIQAPGGIVAGGIIADAITVNQSVTADEFMNAGSYLYFYSGSTAVYGIGNPTIRGDSTANLAISPGTTNSNLDFGFDSVFNTNNSGKYRFWSGPDSGGSNNTLVASIDRSGNLITAKIAAQLFTAGGTSFDSLNSTNQVFLSVAGNRTYFDAVGDSSRSSFEFRIMNQNAANLLSALVIDSSGNGTFAGTITGSAKNFRITHPLDDTKYLTHSCIEGPEYAVLYCGEGETADGSAEITLPDYFEALTMPTNRTVQLTALYEDEDEGFGQLAASRVEDGMFRVRSANASQKFYWEVKAVRADIEPLEVVTDIPLVPTQLPTQPQPDPEPKASQSKKVVTRRSR